VDEKPGSGALSAATERGGWKGMGGLEGAAGGTTAASAGEPYCCRSQDQSSALGGDLLVADGKDLWRTREWGGIRNDSQEPAAGDLGPAGEDQLEALLLGQAGLLEGVFRDEHPGRLQQEFRHLRVKYTLPADPLPAHFLRMRPGNFPTIRLAQLAKLLKGGSFWFSRCKEARSFGDLKVQMEVAAGSYWDDHYIPDRTSSRRVKRLGEGLKDSLLINVFVPLLYAYGALRNEPELLEKAMDWLKALPAEKNIVIGRWKSLYVMCRHAGDSQALLELKKHYCDQKNCLQCAVGKNILCRGDGPREDA